MDTSLVATLPTAIVGLIVAWIALRQWLTAHQRLVLDLCDKRFGVYMAAQDAIAEHITSGEVTREMMNALLAARYRADFLFGDDVTNYLVATLEALTKYKHLANDNRNRTPEQEEAHQEKLGACIDHLTNFFQHSRVLFRPYMLMDQKLVIFPSFWSRFGSS